jgi:hypothetical protein
VPDDGGQKNAGIFETTAALFRAGAELLVSQIERLERGGDHGMPQDSAGSYQSWPSRTDVRALRASRGVLIRLADLKRML